MRMNTSNDPNGRRGDRCEFALSHRPNLRRVEIEITTRCNLMCRHCDRRCSQAPAEVDIQFEDIERFVAESRTLGYQWEKIALLGGEPTLHPNLEEIIGTISDFVGTLEACEFFLVTNSCGRDVKRTIRSIDSLISIEKRPKSPNEPWFTNMDLAPIDVAESVTSCEITSICGLGLTPWGYFPCGAGAAIARSLDLDIGIRSLRDVNEENMIALLERLCQFCGHALPTAAGKDDSVSPFWEKATADYRLRHRL